MIAQGYAVSVRGTPCGCNIGLTDTGRDVHFLEKGGKGIPAPLPHCLRACHGISSVFCSFFLAASFPHIRLIFRFFLLFHTHSFVLASWISCRPDGTSWYVVLNNVDASTLVFFAIVFIFEVYNVRIFRREPRPFSLPSRLLSSGECRRKRNIACARMPSPLRNRLLSGKSKWKRIGRANSAHTFS